MEKSSLEGYDSAVFPSLGWQININYLENSQSVSRYNFSQSFIDFFSMPYGNHYD